jgi:hypothetical protein
MKTKSSLALSLILISNLAHGVTGTATSYKSPNSIEEQCIQIEDADDGNSIYKNKDREKSKELCDVDFYSETTLLCPKLTSTSPGTYVYSLKESKISKKDAAAQCTGLVKDKSGKLRADLKIKKIGSYKQTMNTGSGTYSISSLLYYFFGRLLNTNAKVPVAVYRTMDVKSHFDLVSSKAKPTTSDLIKGWNGMQQAESNPAKWSEKDMLFTDGYKQIFGAFLHAGGERYGTYFHGSRESGWGAPAYGDLKNTPSFKALQTLSKNPQQTHLEAAIAVGLSTGTEKYPYIKTHKPKEEADKLGNPLTKFEIVNWMQDWSEIAVLDHVLSQQDRIGNEDYNWYWAYGENGLTHYKKVDDEFKDKSRIAMATLINKKQLLPPTKIANLNPILLQRTILGDNDAGAGAGPHSKARKYANFTKISGVVKLIQHMNADFYIKFQKLAKDFRDEGQVFNYVKNEIGLIEPSFENLKTNIAEVSDILRNSCKAGNLKFDLNIDEFIMTSGQTKEQIISCDI